MVARKVKTYLMFFCLFVCFLLIRFIFRKKVATDLFKRCFVELKDC